MKATFTTANAEIKTTTTKKTHYLEPDCRDTMPAFCVRGAGKAG